MNPWHHLNESVQDHLNVANVQQDDPTLAKENVLDPEIENVLDPEIENVLDLEIENVPDQEKEGDQGQGKKDVQDRGIEGDQDQGRKDDQDVRGHVKGIGREIGLRLQ